MENSIKNTGEQYIPEISSVRLRDEHVARYEFAELYCRDKTVMDIACGAGYGSDKLSKTAKLVVGVDKSEEAINYANLNYKASNLQYIVDDATDLKKIDQIKFDVVVSFETIEHLDKQGRIKFLQNIYNFLAPSGLLILSTPNKKITSPFSDKPLNKFHVIEFTKESLFEEVSKFFKIKKIFGQRFVSIFLLSRPARLVIWAIEKIFRHDFGFYSTRYNYVVREWKSSAEQPRIILILAGTY